MRDPYHLRLEIIRSVQALGIKPTARRFGTSVPTVRKWWRRYQQAQRSGQAGGERSSRLIVRVTA